MDDPGDISEEALVERIRVGDEEAFRVLFDRYAERIRARIRRRMPNRLERKVSVADVLQETRLVAYQKSPAFEARGEESYGRWLHRIAELKVREAVRRYARPKRAQHREVSRGHRADTQQFVGSARSPSAAAAAAEDVTRVREVLSTLSEDDREILRLTFEERLTLREAAERLGCSREASKKRYARALGRFKKAHRGGEGGGHGT